MTPRAGGSDDRRTTIADTVIDLLAHVGVRGLTHRAVDAAAGLPPGSTSYYFRTREALLVAAAHRLADLDLASADASSAPQLPETPEALGSVLAELVQAQAVRHRTRTVARYELSLEASRYPEVQAALTAMGERFAAAATAMLAGLGSRNPSRDARAIIAVCAGLVYESTVGAQKPYTQKEIQAVLRDVLAARLSR